MVSEFALPKDVVPEFQVWSNGERVGKDEERRLINNENIEARTFKDHVLTFKTPTQDVNNLHEIYARNFEIKLVARRKSDNAHSKPFPFFFFTHNEIPMSDMNDGSNSCLYCTIYTNEEMPSIKQAIPGEKKRKIPSSAEKKKTPKSRRLSDALTNGSGILSPDSAIGISPTHDSFENLIEVHQTSENGFSHDHLGSAARVEEIQEESHNNHNYLANGTSLEVVENTKEMLVDGSTEEHSNSEEFTGAENIIDEILEKESQSPGIVEEEILDPEMLEKLDPDEIPDESFEVIETDQATAKNEATEETTKPKSCRPSSELVDTTQQELHSGKSESVEQQMGTEFKQSILHDYADILTDTKRSMIPRIVLVFLLLALQLAGHRTEERSLSKLVNRIQEVYWTFPIPFLLLLLLILISSLGWLDQSFVPLVQGDGLLLGVLASLAISVAIARTV